MLNKSILKIILLLIHSSFCLAQIPETLIRSSRSSNSTMLRDSATRSVELVPNFSFDAQQHGNYIAYIKNEITVFWPKTGQVIQRSNNNSSYLKFKGKCTDLDVDSLWIEAIPVYSGANVTKKIFCNALGEFSDSLLLIGGDYIIKLKDLISNGQIVTIPKYAKGISRVGVGEVFMLWGHSFMGGDGFGVSAQNELSRATKTFIFDTLYNFSFFQNLAQMPIEYKKIDTASVGPFAEKSWIAGMLADSLASKFGVPVLMYSTAFGGSNIYQNKQNITNQPFGYTWFGGGSWQNNGFPFKNVQAAFEHFIPHTGLRAILVAHGVNDHDNNNNGGNRLDFQQNFQLVINRIRNVETPNVPNLAFILGFEDGGFTDINNQLLNLINSDVNIHEGIDLRNSNTHGPWRDDGYGFQRGHFKGLLGLEKYGNLWNTVITTGLINSITPITPYFTN